MLNSHVESIPPVLVSMNANAIADARRVCGNVLLACHVAIDGPAVYVPGIIKNREPYWIWWLFGYAKKRQNPMIGGNAAIVAMTPRHLNRSDMMAHVSDTRRR